MYDVHMHAGGIGLKYTVGYCASLPEFKRDSNNNSNNSG